MHAYFYINPYKWSQLTTKMMMTSRLGILKKGKKLYVVSKEVDAEIHS